uniref:Uncharacterized protein n=1 Tax=Anguilla anguilla TaxID=7936 RepID=A0A0E9TVP4_ANGAN
MLHKTTYLVYLSTYCTSLWIKASAK